MPTGSRAGGDGGSGDEPIDWVVLSHRLGGSTFKSAPSSDTVRQLAGRSMQHRVPGRGRAAVCDAAGLGCSAVMAQQCAGVVELSASGMQRCVQRLDLNRVGGTMHCCVHLCTQGALGRPGSRRHRRRDRRALLSMWGTRTSEGTGGRARAQEDEDRQMCGEWRSFDSQSVV